MKMNDINKDIKNLIHNHVKTKEKNDVDSPYAKYNSRGQLMCIVCGIPVKSKIVWQAHVKKKSHAENLAKLKQKQEKINQLQYEKLERSNVPKVSAPSPAVSNAKVAAEKPKGILKGVNNYSSSDEDETFPVEVKKIKTEVPSSSDDDPLRNASNPRLKELPKPPSLPSKRSSTSLPEGFFDNPVEDAKARNVEYRDKKAEEWQAFQKEVSAAEVQSRVIIAEDKEEAAIETQLEQTAEQIKCLQRIVDLDQARQTHLEKKPTDHTHKEDDSSDEEFSPVIWRTKNSLI